MFFEYARSQPCFAFMDLRIHDVRACAVPINFDYEAVDRIRGKMENHFFHFWHSTYCASIWDDGEDNSGRLGVVFKDNKV
jgi:hypothetical protein